MAAATLYFLLLTGDWKSLSLHLQFLQFLQFLAGSDNASRSTQNALSSCWRLHQLSGHLVGFSEGTRGVKFALFFSHCHLPSVEFTCSLWYNIQKLCNSGHLKFEFSFWYIKNGDACFKLGVVTFYQLGLFFSSQTGEFNVTLITNCCY